MRSIIILLSFILINNRCDQTNVQQEKISIKYTSITRGSYQQITVNNKTISMTHNRDGDLKTKTCSDKEWLNLITEFNKIDLKNLSNIKPPTENHQYDGAAAATLLIIKNNITYETQSFDHGNPPIKIASLVKEILSIVENIE